jgi:glutathione S-transferase
MFTDPYDGKAVEQSRRALAATLGKFERNLSETGPWLAGSSFSLADIAAAPVIDRIEQLKMADLWENLPTVKDWVERIKSKPAYKKAQPSSEFRMLGLATAS